MQTIKDTVYGIYAKLTHKKIIQYIQLMSKKLVKSKHFPPCFFKEQPLVAVKIMTHVSQKQNLKSLLHGTIGEEDCLFTVHRRSTVKVVSLNQGPLLKIVMLM